MRSSTVFVTIIALAAATPALADDVKVGIGISGLTGFAPLTLAKEAGIFKKNGLDVTIKKIPQKDRHLAIAVGAPCLVIDRYTWRSARTITAVRLLYPGDSHRLVARFKGG